MAAFVAPPMQRKERVPVITVEELSSALRAYIPTVYAFSYIGEDVEANRGLRTTTLHYYGSDPANPAKRLKLEATIDGKACTGYTSKLFDMPFDVSLYEKPDDPFELMKLSACQLMEFSRARTRYLQIEPRADRSIVIRHIVRWDNGRPIFAD